MSDRLARALEEIEQGRAVFRVSEELTPLVEIAQRLRTAERPRLSPDARAAMKARLMAKIAASGANGHANGHTNGHANGHASGNGHYKNGNGNGHHPIDMAMAIEALGPGASNGKVVRLQLRPRGHARRSLLAQALPKMAAACLVAAMLTGGTVAASADSLPGDVFYPAKIAVEKVQLAATLDESGKARLHLEFADRRLAELDRKVERGDAPGGTAPLAVKYSEEIRAAAASIQRASSSSTTPGEQEKVAELTTRLIEDTTVRAAPKLERVAQQEPAVKPRVQAAIETAVQVAAVNAPKMTAVAAAPTATATEAARASAAAPALPTAAPPRGAPAAPEPQPTSAPPPNTVAPAAPAARVDLPPPTATTAPPSPLARTLATADGRVAELAAAVRTGSAPAVEQLVRTYSGDIQSLRGAFVEDVARGADRDQAAAALAGRLSAQHQALLKAVEQAPPLARPAVREYLYEIQASMQAVLREVEAPTGAEPTPVPSPTAVPPTPKPVDTPMPVWPTATRRPAVPTTAPAVAPTVAATAVVSPTAAATAAASPTVAASPSESVTPLAAQPSPSAVSSPAASPTGVAASPTGPPASATAAPAGSATAAPASATAAPAASPTAPSAAGTPSAQMTPMRLANPTTQATAVPAKPTSAPAAPTAAAKP